VTFSPEPKEVRHGPSRYEDRPLDAEFDLRARCHVDEGVASAMAGSMTGHRSVNAHPVAGLSPITAGRSVIAAQPDHDVVRAARLDQNDDLPFPFGNDT